jgi:O-antigen/teichoic acid export membrane protein
MRFILSLGEQGMGSIVTFGINLWLIRNGEASSYGVYVFWYAVAWVLGTCQGTLTIVHLFALPAGSDRLAERRDPERILLSATTVLLLLAALGVAITNRVLVHVGSTLAEPAAILFIPAFLLFQYVRAFAFSRQRVLLATCLTGGILVTSALGLGLDSLVGHRPDAARALLLIGGSYGGCSLVVLWILARGLTPMYRPSELRRFAHYLGSSGWLILGAASGEVTGRLYSFAVVGQFGTEALARLSAVQVVIRPAWLLSAAWLSIGFPTMSRHRADGNRAALIRTMLQGAVMTTAGSAVWSAAVIVGWPWISTALYRGRYEDIGILAYLWGANVLLGGIALALNTAMLVLGDFRRLALLDLVGAFVCVVAILALLNRFGYAMAIVAIMLGQVTQISLMTIAVTHRLRRLVPLPA